MTLEASFWIWRRLPLAQVALSALHSSEEVSRLCPMSHLHKAPSITVLGTLQGNHLACGSVPPRKTSRTKAMSYSHLVSADTWHAARTQRKKKQLLISTGLENDHLTSERWNAVSAYTRLTVSNLSIILKMLKRWAISLVKSLSQVVAILLI